MKNLIIIFISVFAAFTHAYAQDPEQQHIQDSAVQISDDELKKYAVTTDSINDMKATLLAELNGMIKADTSITFERYKELAPIISDEAKLAAANATESEKALVRRVADRKAEGIETINSTFQSLAREYVGVASYNKVKKALTTDAELNAKYEAMLKELDNDGGKP